MFENITRKFYSDDEQATGLPGDWGPGAVDESARESNKSPTASAKKYYANSEEKFLKRVIVYACSNVPNPPKMCYDPDGLTPVYPDEAFDLFIKNLMVICRTALDVTTYHTPSNMKSYNGGYIFTIYDDSGNAISVSSSPNPTTSTTSNTDDPNPGKV